jgi:hypothetical protein
MAPLTDLLSCSIIGMLNYSYLYIDLNILHSDK